MTLIGIDDTDSRKGMCTTYLMAQFIRELVGMGVDIIGYPRLVRLNPNIPYKTRGNGALCVEVGKGKGDRMVIGQWNGEEIHGYSERDGLSGTKASSSDKILSLASETIEKFAELDSPGTDPGIVIFESRPEYGSDIYRKAVRDVVSIEEAEEFISTNGEEFRKFNSGRGIIGASAACSWEPMDRTFEIISYRHPPSFGTPRTIDRNSVIELDVAFPSTFNNYDHVNDHIAITPSSPCPVLHAIRGEYPQELISASEMVRGERAQGWFLFESNQGTDDHLHESLIKDIRPYQSVRVKGEVKTGPRDLTGGHVVFTLQDGTGSIDCIAYEPTKEFRRTIRALVPGDEVIVCGGVREEPFTINLEKIRILKLVERKRKLSNPLCPDCGKGMKSIGTGQGYRCKGCGTKAEEGDAEFMEKEERSISPGWYEVPVCARRHLHKPLRRF